MTASQKWHHLEVVEFPRHRWYGNSSERRGIWYAENSLTVFHLLLAVPKPCRCLYSILVPHGFMSSPQLLRLVSLGPESSFFPHASTCVSLSPVSSSHFLSLISFHAYFIPYSVNTGLAAPLVASILASVSPSLAGHFEPWPMLTWLLWGRACPALPWYYPLPSPDLTLFTHLQHPSHSRFSGCQYPSARSLS